MSVDEILALLDDKPLGETVLGHAVKGGADYAPSDAPAAASRTALKVDQWGMGRANELAEADWNQPPAVLNERHIEHGLVTLADAHTACFEPCPQLAANHHNAVRSRWFGDLLASPDFRALHAQTVMDLALSEIGTKQIADQWAAYIKNLPQQDREQIEQAAQGGETEESIESEMRRIRSVAKAVQNAASDVREAQEISRGLGGEGGVDGKRDTQDVLKLFQRVRNDQTLRRICELAGRYRRVAQSRQRRKALHGVDDLVGVELGGDVGRIIPAEAACLVIPELELDALRRIAERQALCREYRGVEPVARGPIVVCVDESGSMHGEPVANAKAMALSLAWVARHQRRWCALVGFSGGTDGTRLVLPPGRWDQDALCEWLEHFYGGGTTLDVPVLELPGGYWSEFLKAGMPRGKTDVVLITDAIVDCPDHMRESFLTWKQQEHVKAYGIVIGNEPGDLATICDRTWRVNTLDAEQDCVGEVLSL